MTSAGLPDILKGWSTIQEELGRSQAEACRDIMKFRKNEVDPCPRETKACGDGGWVWWRWGASQGRASGPCVQQAELGKDPGSLDYPMNTWTYLMVLFLHGCVFSSAFCVYICGYLRYLVICERLWYKSGLKHKKGLYCLTESNDIVNTCHITQHSPRYIQCTLREACLILKLAGICLNTCSRFVNSCSFVSRCIYSGARCLAIGDTLSNICWDTFTSSKGQEL